MSKTTVLGPVRFSYCNIFKPADLNNSGIPKYSITVLMPKNDKQLMAKLKKAIEEAKQEGANKFFNGKVPPNLKTTVHDGDGLRPSGEPFGKECKGCYVMTCTTGVDFPPEVVVGQDRHPAMPNEVKSGDYGFVSVNFAPYDKNGNRGISSYLGNVLKTKSGPALGSVKTTANDDFGNLNLTDDDFDSVEVDPLTGKPLNDIDSDFELLADDDLPI